MSEGDRAGARTLVFLRHAKAEPAMRARGDAERPLSHSGFVDASAAGSWFVKAGICPDLVYCSPARRTRQTWHAVEVELGDRCSPEVVFEPLLYSEGLRSVLDLIAAVPPEVATLTIVGHNPTVSIASAVLSGLGAGDGMRTAGIAVHRVETWAECGPGLAPLIRVHTSRG